MVVLKGMEPQTDCQKCPFIATDGIDTLSPMMCMALWKSEGERMTREEREEAISVIKSECYVFNPLNFDRTTRINTALDMAIEALDQESMLDKIRADVIARYPKNYAGEPELGGCACEFSLNQILQIIDKYKTETEGEE